MRQNGKVKRGKIDTKTLACQRLGRNRNRVLPQNTLKTRKELYYATAENVESTGVEAVASVVSVVVEGVVVEVVSPVVSVAEGTAGW